MEEKNVLSNASGILTDSASDRLEFTIEPKTFLDKLLVKLRLKKKQIMSYELRPILVGNRYKIACKALNIPSSILESGIMTAIMKGSHDHTDDFIYIAAVAIQNDRNEPSKELLEELRWVDDKTLAVLLDKALSTIDVQAFMKSIILILGAEILSQKKVSPTD
ncbi:hypothetical protein [Desertivirga xinjiangensis]|uniref:hypothetical protein n=1 Tax=Desertivirga xinjiangensis TaxID=539206 RepID=UPI00210AE004|nr:hypothetical protein [Pedobacter xinjiangensis]